SLRAQRCVLVPPSCAPGRRHRCIRGRGDSWWRGTPKRAPALRLPCPYDTARACYFCLGGYFSRDFFTMSSSLPSILLASLFSTGEMPRQTSDRVLGPRESMTRVPSVHGTRTTRVPQPRHPAG